MDHRFGSPRDRFFALFHDGGPDAPSCFRSEISSYPLCRRPRRHEVSAAPQSLPAIPPGGAISSSLQGNENWARLRLKWWLVKDEVLFVAAQRCDQGQGQGAGRFPRCNGKLCCGLFATPPSTSSSGESGRSRPRLGRAYRALAGRRTRSIRSAWQSWRKW